MTPEFLDGFDAAPAEVPSLREIVPLLALFPSARPLGLSSGPSNVSAS